MIRRARVRHLCGMVTPLAIVSLIVWALAFLGLTPSLLRVYRNTGHPDDEERGALLFSAGLIVAFNPRRLLMEDNREALAALYSISILLGLYILLLLYRRRKP